MMDSTTFHSDVTSTSAAKRRRDNFTYFILVVSCFVGFFYMKINCSKLSNKDDLVVLVGIAVIACLLGLAVYLAIYHDKFIAGFYASTITWKWHDWIYKPIDRALDKLWPDDKVI